MVEMLLDTNTLPESLIRLVHAEKVKVRKAYGEIRLTPVKAGGVGLSCPFLGMFADGKVSVSKFIASKRLEKALEQ